MLVDTIVPPRSHGHEDADEPSLIALGPRNGNGPADSRSDDVHLTGRTRQNKLVHLTGRAAWLGTLVDVTVEHAGPYALRGRVA